MLNYQNTLQISSQVREGTFSTIARVRWGAERMGLEGKEKISIQHGDPVN